MLSIKTRLERAEKHTTTKGVLKEVDTFLKAIENATLGENGLYNEVLPDSLKTSKIPIIQNYFKGVKENDQRSSNKN